MTVNIKFVIYALIIILGTLGLLDDDNLSGENIFYSLLKWVSFILIKQKHSAVLKISYLFAIHS